MKKALLLLLFTIVIMAYSVPVFAENVGWECPECGAEATGNFCSNCGAKKPEWTCLECGEIVVGNFCNNCGTKNPEFLDIEIGDYITFGSYEQDNDLTNGSEPIEWLVLDKKDGKALIISQYGLDSKAYNTEHTDITWEICSLRGWLNDTFFQKAFTDEEYKRIEETDVIMEDNEEYGTKAGNNTVDKVFLLCTSETELLFKNNDTRVCYPTEYAIAQGAFTNEDKIGRKWA